MSKKLHRPSKSFNPGLTFGVSAESPDNFHVKHTQVLDNRAKNQSISQSDKHPGVFLSDLKRNKFLIKPRFIYEDLNNFSGFYFDTIKFRDRCDLVSKDQERVRCKTPFVVKWKKQSQTVEKFKIFQGNFTATANQLFEPRVFTGKIETLKKIIEKKQITRQKTPDVIEQGKSHLKFLEEKKKIHKKKLPSAELGPAELFDKEISYFEKQLKYVPDRKRWCYEM